MNIEIIQGDITEQETDAIVNAANNHLWMGSGVAGAIKKKGGEEIEKEAVEKGPIEIGQAIATKAGKLKAKYVIHAAGMGQDLATSADKVKQTTFSSLKVADSLQLNSISFPAIGTGVGGLGLDQCAESMLNAIFEFQPDHLQSVRFVLFDPTAKQVFESVYKKMK
ncbi:MAG: macro domain-containing protein [candidate division Zixibacteria bacterium]|nr:macro domain-containing protein [candidate division Zixibacteria bacterium]NIR66186.1 macro domain-containing protein [candidate division Zixibacteria bacterium]NIS17266.1 macro domain-containing protein [candidate division Zixibacteria bacterium]NIS47809.1 macro domain-containing protein [candidate division Zixibacteria bacterium]NIT53623.1 macro domain-containing protein [candidate division Zixibacteria bacterium]